MNQIYYLINNLGSKRELSGLYLVEGNTVKYLTINEKEEKNHIVKNLSISKRIEFELDKDENLLEALFLKDKIYSKSPDLKEYFSFITYLGNIMIDYTDL